ncbi:MAG: hypothetical protein E4H28_01970 [Gemmatimonadales bacterium]|nr:MAG: hypothetical protein E4H28_01970 [Gemmatimonadales bacterium]
MSAKQRLVTILLPAVLAGSFLPGTLHTQEVKNIKPGKTYTSPLKDFEVTAPDLCFGTKIQQQHDKNGGMVAFVSDVGQLDRIDFERVDANIATTIAQADSAVKLAMYAEHLNSTVVQPNNASLLVKEPFKMAQTEALFAVAEFPGGGVLEVVKFGEEGMVRERMDSVRGLMVFLRGEILYVLHHEVGVNFDAIGPCGLSGQGGPELTPEERDRVAREGLQKLYATIIFK